MVGDVSKKSTRDAIGAIAWLSTGKLRQRRDVVSGASFCSQNDMTLHFGLGTATRVSKLEIEWADGTIENVPIPSIDKSVTITQGKGSK